MLENQSSEKKITFENYFYILKYILIIFINSE